MSAAGYRADKTATASRVNPDRSLKRDRRDLDRPLPGKWLLHCHIPHQTTNENVEEEGAGGLTTVIDVSA
jgi:hypothetical protein